MRKYIICFLQLVVSLFLFANCTSRSGDSGVPKVISIDVSAVEKIKLPSEHALRIPLDGNTALGNVKKLYMRDSAFYIHSQQQMHVFDRDGHFIGNISRQGRAGNEYLSLWYSWIDGSGLNMYDLNGRKIIRYGFADKSVKTEELPTDVTAFQALMPIGGEGFIGKLGFTGGGDTNGNPELGFFDTEYGFRNMVGDLKLNSGLWLGYPFSAYNDEVLYWRQLDDMIYSIDKGLNLRIKYTLDYLDKSVPDMDFVDDYAKIDFMNMAPELYAGCTFDVEETDETLCFVFIYDKAKNLAVWSKKNDGVNIYEFIPDEAETVNAVIPHGDKVIVVSDLDDGRSVLYLMDLDGLRIFNQPVSAI